MANVKVENKHSGAAMVLWLCSWIAVQGVQGLNSGIAIMANSCRGVAEIKFKRRKISKQPNSNSGHLFFSSGIGGMVLAE